MYTARPVIRRSSLAITLSLIPLSTIVQTPRQPSLQPHTWYEFLLKKCNPSGFDYGAWLERRREAFQEATVKGPQFWYSSSVTIGLLFMIAAYTKLMLDNRRRMRITAEMMTDLYSHDLYSRQAAKEAIGRYNQHIEQCNSAIEAGESGDGRPGWGSSQVESLRTELQRVTDQLEATTEDRNKLQEELRQKSLIVADLSTRMDALSIRVNGPRDSSSGGGEPMSTCAGDGARFVSQINRLQEELYAERQKNKRLKGA